MCSGWPATPIMMMVSLASMADSSSLYSYVQADKRCQVHCAACNTHNDNEREREGSGGGGGGGGGG